LGIDLNKAAGCGWLEFVWAASLWGGADERDCFKAARRRLAVPELQPA